MFVSTKTFEDFPCAHRQHRHAGNCSLIHGYSRSFKFTFAAAQQDRCGFVVDFGGLKWLKLWLEDNFDHTLLLEHDDPLMPQLTKIHQAGGCKIVVPPYGVGMEGTAQWLLEVAQAGLDSRMDPGRKVQVVSVEARENRKNSAVYHNPAALAAMWAALPIDI